ncbi:putative conserved fungal protein [Diaporthe ampelina]|uniref:Putative conserved fungal protein n=1 Tax=Diaporthe ampelina TaxID=1214573 RepID=A0A0G2FVH3_9PEZI|nr:putative conserved fungal protein [Diaporthe ampelina]
MSRTANPLASAWASTRLKSTLIYPDPPTNNHHDLPSFLAYADRTGLDQKSTLYVGTHYEYTVVQVLSKYGFYLKRVGGHSDYGIDLLGTWNVPSSKEPLRVLAQCKAIARKSSPNLVRELEGAFVGAPVGWKEHGVLGVFVTEKPATKGVRDSLSRSRWPMCFISCTRAGHVQQMLWNHRAEEDGLEGLGVGMRHTGRDGESQLSMLWKGQHILLEVITGVRRLDNAQESFDGLQFVHHAYSEAAG